MAQDNEMPDSPLLDWNWFDPNSPKRFVKRGFQRLESASSERLLQNNARAIDEIYDYMSVLEQFYANPKGGGRGGKCAAGDPARKLDLLEARQQLESIGVALDSLHSQLRRIAEEFVAKQIAELGVREGTRGLRLNLGSAGLPIPGWLNVDAGGGDIIANVNWGLPFPDGSASFVYCSHMLEHLRFNDQAPIFLAEVVRVLETGGTARFVVPHMRELIRAYASGDKEYFASRQIIYPLPDAFLVDGVGTLDYVLLFAGAAQQILNYNHKFSYDEQTLTRLLKDAGFSFVEVSCYQGSDTPELRVDDQSFNARAADSNGRHFSLFVEARK